MRPMQTEKQIRMNIPVNGTVSRDSTEVSHQ